MNKKKIKIVIIGDSNTAGFGLDDITQSFPYKLNKKLGDEFIVYNMGITGSCVINTLYKSKVVGMPYVREALYTKVLNIDGDIFIINLGTNDAQDGMDYDLSIKDEYSNLISYHHRFYKDYVKIINDIKKLYTDAKILMCIPIPIRKCIWRKHQQKYLDILIPYYNDILKHYPQVKCVDLQSAFLKLDDLEIDSMYLDDGLHLNNKGTSFVSNIIEPFINNAITKSKTL